MNEPLSDCCGADVYPDIDICSECKEHCAETVICPECDNLAYRVATHYEGGESVDWDGWECESCHLRFNTEND